METEKQLNDKLDNIFLSVDKLQDGGITWLEV